ncbi:MAG: DUF3849 domain-containing protein [Oscillospiraceae bacterium]|nr:DUF3849 domain-containing protein [Oscillospiraceae bacterium]
MAYTRKEYTPEERAAYNAQKQAEMDEMIERIDEGVKAVFQSEKYKEYLKFASKFTDYSARNTLLINLQRPDATLVAAYGKWKQLGRQVERGQTGIEILAPVAYKTNQVLETERPAVDEFGNQLYNPDGTEKMETVEKPMTGLAFKKVYVFDVSQTSGKELPDPVTELTGDIDSARKEAVFAALKKVTGIDIEFKDIKGGAKGYYSATNNEIVIKSGMSDAQTLKTAFHEAAHNLLHDPAKDIVTNKSPRNEKEVQAESVAFMVAERFGIDTSEYSFPYIASWSDGKQLEQLKSALQEIQEAAKKISSEIESEVLKLQKRNLTMDEKLADTELNNIQKAEFLIEDCADRGVNFSKEDTDKILDFAGNHENISDTVQLVTDMEEIQRQRDSYGYDFTYMTPIDTKEAALEAYDRGEAVYLLYPDNTEGMAESRSEIENFEGYFGIEKEPSPDVVREQNSELIPVSKEIALEMWDKDLDVYVEGVRAERREDIENAPETAKLYLSEFQYTAQLEFEKSQRGNVDRTAEPASKNPNVIGNTPYDELGEKGQLEYITKLKTRHALNIAKQLDEDGVKFSGLKKGTVTTITINKADKEKYEAAVEKVKESYSKSKEQTAEPLADKTPVPKPAPQKPVNIVADIDKAISDSNYELYRYNLKQAAATVIEEHGAEKVSRTLAEYIVRHDYDGRISEKNKEWAKRFDIPENRYPPVFHTHPAVLDGFITEAQTQIKALEKSVSQPELPDICKDKFLLPVERVELRDDHRGIPETKYYDSSVNEYFVDGIGWLDNAAYDREQKFSELSPKDFYAKVTQINCSYVDTEGRKGQIDVSKKDYDILTEKTYSKENSEAYKAAKDKLEQRKQEVGIKPKPVEYYAVRQTSDRKFAVATISADGLVTVAKSGIATIAEAKKALLDIYKSKQSTVKCEFVHPQTLDEKSAEIYRSQTKELPAVTYRITPNPDKKSSDTHILQEYVKNSDDTYAIGKVMAKGDYEKCNSRLANLINPPKIEAPVKTFEIYQIRRVDETRDVRFEPYERLLKAGLKPDFKTYDKMYEADVSMLSGKSTGEKLESAFYVFNQERPEDFKGHSLSVSDVVVLDDTAYYVDSVGFKPLKDFIPLEIQQSRFLDTLPQTLQGISDNATELEAVSDKALKLNIPPEIIREACDMVNGGENLDNMANVYEEKFTEKNAPAEEAPEIEKPKPQKKPKL